MYADHMHHTHVRLHANNSANGGSSLATYSGPILVELLCNIYVKCSLVCMKTLLVTPGVSLFPRQSFYGMNLDETPPCEVIYRCHKQDERDF